MPASSEAEHRSSNRVMLGGILALLLLAAGVRWWLNRKVYPPVSSGTSLVLIKQLYTACNTKNLALLDKFEQRLSREQQQGQVSPAEANHFQEISSQARAGEWEAASKSAYRFARDQRSDL
jgi:hypothetical protein